MRDGPFRLFSMTGSCPLPSGPKERKAGENLAPGVGRQQEGIRLPACPVARHSAEGCPRGGGRWGCLSGISMELRTIPRGQTPTRNRWSHKRTRAQKTASGWPGSTPRISRSPRGPRRAADATQVRGRRIGIRSCPGQAPLQFAALSHFAMSR